MAGTVFLHTFSVLIRTSLYYTQDFLPPITCSPAHSPSHIV